MLFTAIDYILWIIIALLVIYLSIMIVRLAKPIRLIADTAGADITHLMEFLTELTRLALVSYIALIGICVLLAISLVLLILVF